MVSGKISFFWINVLFLVILEILLLVFGYIQNELFNSFFYLIPLYGSLLNLLVYKLILKLSGKKNNFQIILTSLFGGKFFGYLIPIILILVLNLSKQLQITGVMITFATYILFTFAITRSVIQFFKSPASDGDNFK